MIIRPLLFLALLLFTPLIAGAADTAEVKGPNFSAKFSKGWLVEWKNTSTGETFSFGEPTIPAGEDYRHYRPGFWPIDSVKPEEEQRMSAAVKYDISAQGPDAISLRESVTGVKTRLRALQWGIQVPFGNGLQIHWPRGLAPARITGAGFQETLHGPDYYFGGRTATYIGAGKLRSYMYVIQGKKGGLVVYMENADLKDFMAIELLPIDPTFKVGGADFRDKLAQGLILSNRSIEPPSAKNENYEGPRWVIRQYDGGLPQAAQAYLDYAISAYRLKPLSERPTAWAQQLGMVFVNTPNVLRGPKVVDGQRQPAYNYLSGQAWLDGIKADTEYLERLAKIIDPSKVLFYTTGWNSGGMDTAFPEYSPDPYVAYMTRKARAMGFHVMLHMHNSLAQYPTAFTDKYIINTAKYLGLDPVKDHIPGVYFDELRNQYLQQDNKEFGSSWNDRNGQRRVYNAFYMNPASGGWRWLFATKIVSSLLATGADAVHLDVPDWNIERYNDQYGMNPMEGQVEFYRLLRQLLDEAGLKDTVIACELTPNEAFMRYVDMAQRARNTSSQGRMDAIARGSDLAGENLITMQTGKSLDSLIKERQEAASATPPPLVPEKALPLFQQTSADLGVPSLDNLLFSRYVQGYPHLGAFFYDKPGGYLAVWNWLINDVIPTGTFDDLTQPVSRFNYGVIALSRFRAQEQMRIETPDRWIAGDVATYKLQDGRRLRAFRADTTTLRLQFENGPVLAEIDVFTGWKNADPLFKKYGPPGIEIAAPSPTPAGK